MMVSASAALAQTGGSVALVSDYRYRGVSLSGEHPQPQVSLYYDDPTGWYAGAFASPVTMQKNSNNLQLIAYSGYAHRLAADTTVEAGIAETAYTQASEYNYVEGFVGMSSEHFGVRIYVSPHYAGLLQRSIYAEFNASYRLREHVNLTAQIGFLHLFDQAESDSYDERLGVNYTLNAWAWQLAWIDSKQKQAILQRTENPSRSTFIVSLTYAF